MPELPDLEVVAEILTPRIVGRTVRGVEVNRAGLLRTGDSSLSAAVGAEVTSVGRRGKCLLVSLGEDLHLVVHLMRWAWLWHGPHGYTPTTATGLRLTLGDGMDLRLIERRTPLLAAAWVVANLHDCEPLGKLGVEPLSPGFTLEALASLLRGRRRTLKRLLTDPSLIAGIGNAYADEILFSAKLSPVRYAHTVNPDEVARLWSATRETLTWAIGEIRARSGGKLMDREIRDFLRVHGKRGAPCPACGTPIAEILYDDVETDYCPHCQETEIPTAGSRQVHIQRQSGPLG